MSEPSEAIPDNVEIRSVPKYQPAARKARLRQYKPIPAKSPGMIFPECLPGPKPKPNLNLNLNPDLYLHLILV